MRQERSSGLDGVLHAKVVELDPLVVEEVEAAGAFVSPLVHLRKRAHAQTGVGILGSKPNDGLKAQLLKKGKVELRGLTGTIQLVLDHPKVGWGDQDDLE